MCIRDRYRNPETKEHIAYREGKKLIGTADYSSLNTHKGMEQSRRDDLEALCYSLIQLLRGNLPWYKLSGKTKEEKFEKIMSRKLSCSTEKLCEGFPPEFQDMLAYTRALEFDAEPDYQRLRDLLKQAYEKNGVVSDGVCDWIVVGEKKAGKRGKGGTCRLL
eukprot:TRINITY_DN7280_c0_g1_i4.p1 TRINITY_DN7280_c0_g1~~TRINITY_DN7280_c0_g1_i4.p1  ORF type:complete len:177 (+),score=39.18 TRINITY_DN7280_c0_g1_i4:48-533(+)